MGDLTADALKKYEDDRKPIVKGRQWKSKSSKWRLKLIHTWWSGRLAQGCQLKQVESFIEGFDYIRKGNDNWFYRVTWGALIKDYRISSGDHTISVGSFCFHMLEMIPPTRVYRRLRGLRSGDPMRAATKERVAFVQMEGLDECNSKFLDYMSRRSY